MEKTKRPDAPAYEAKPHGLSKWAMSRAFRAVIEEKKMTQIQVTQIRSIIGRPDRQRKTLLGLGLKRPNQTVLLRDTPAIRGMVLKVQHLVEVRVMAGEAPLTGRRHRAS